MKVIIEGNPKEIAALVLAVQERQKETGEDEVCCGEDIPNPKLASCIDGKFESSGY